MWATTSSTREKHKETKIMMKDLHAATVAQDAAFFNANIHCCRRVKSCMHVGRWRSAWQNPAVCVYTLPQVAITVYLRETLTVDTVAEKKKPCHFGEKNGLLCLSEGWHRIWRVVGMFLFCFLATVRMGWGEDWDLGSLLPRGEAIYSVLFLDLGLPLEMKKIKVINCPIFMTQILW